MNLKKNKIIFTGGSGRFGKVLKKINTKYNVFFPSKKKLNITNYNKSENYIRKIIIKTFYCYYFHFIFLSQIYLVLQISF